MIELTETAVAKISDIMSEEDNSKYKLRVFVQGGGCSGFSYGFTLDEDEPAEDDFIIDAAQNIKVVVDSMSLQYLTGSKIDFKEDLTGSSFSISNPNASSTCGCGSSFSV